MKQIYLARDRVDADRVCGELRGLGFEAVVIGDLVAIPSATFPSVWVSDTEADSAAVAWAELRDSRDGAV